ncbi:hypothetical protein A2999_02780 [Candidatus Wolfebacteria bacterium RIFCSPLOWO2_01_FULL_38_11]|uniref:Uncharacterized protein n=1 Tax=Candidatus Wolfebacteria bacterium RIFCSPLOWO2_01_FULL_38_11 TaxID=1802556 RepID=A0A1F8DSK5_9BACT|nr:MAG: hypothetical protein A2999_02780 [Candidatus Wolfebacteria bacterium RIFCSPLOWO2_01_FULL_38_11]
MSFENIPIKEKNFCPECGDVLPNHFLTCARFNENKGSEPEKKPAPKEKEPNNFLSQFEKERKEKIDYFANQLNIRIVEGIEPLIGSRKELPDEKEKGKIKSILEKIISQTLIDAPPTLLKEIFAKVIILEVVKDFFEEIKEKTLKESVWEY